ncbi:MAG: hypothetical protein NZ699_07020, partial [Roseiflexus sp.]|nr:hypothetical protein [Roseiflexus sp.]
ADAAPLRFAARLKRSVSSPENEMQKVKAVVEVVAAFGLPLLLIAVDIAVLFALGWLLKRKPTANENGIFLALSCQHPAWNSLMKPGLVMPYLLSGRVLPYRLLGSPTRRATIILWHRRS